MSTRKQVPPNYTQFHKTIQNHRPDIQDKEVSEFQNSILDKHGKIFGTRSQFSQNQQDSTRDLYTTFIYGSLPIEMEQIDE